MNLNEAGRYIVRGVAAAGFAVSSVGGASVDASHFQHAEPNPIIQPSLEGIPSANATLQGNNGETLQITTQEREKPKTPFLVYSSVAEAMAAVARSESPKNVEQQTDRYNTPLHQMDISTDGRFTVGLTFNNDKFYIVGGEDAKLKNFGEVGFHTNTLALNKKNPLQFAVGGSETYIPTKGKLKYTKDGGKTWNTVDTGKGGVYFAYFTQDGKYLEFTEYSNDKKVWMGRLDLETGTISHREATSVQYVELLTSLVGMHSTQNPDEYIGYATTFPREGFVKVTSKRDRVELQDMGRMGTMGLPFQYFDMKGQDALLQFDNAVFGRPPYGDPQESNGEVRSFVNGVRTPSRDFQTNTALYHSIYGNRGAISILGIWASSKDNSAILATTYQKDNSQGGTTFIPSLEFVADVTNPSDLRRESRYLLPKNGDWPSEGIIVPFGGFRVYYVGDEMRMRVAITTERSNATGMPDKGIIVDLISGQWVKTGEFIEAQSVGGKKYFVFAPTITQSVLNTSIAPR